MEMNQVLYETDYFVMTPDVFDECMQRAEKLGVDVDYYLFEFCNIMELEGAEGKVI